MTQFRLNIHGQEQAFEVNRQGARLHVAGEGQAAEVRIIHRDGPRLLIEIARPDGTTQRVQLAGARQGDKRQLWVDGRGLMVERVRQRGGGPAAHGSLTSAIPAVVSQILVAVGDEVAAGDKLILLESMKMVIPIQSPHAGRVTRILCDPGESVPAGVPLVEVEEN